MYKITCFLFTLFVIASCSNQEKNDGRNETEKSVITSTKMDVKSTNCDITSSNMNLRKYAKYGVSFEYPVDYLIEEKILEEGHYFKVYLDKNDEMLYRSVQIEWRNNPLKYDPLSGREGQKKTIVSNYGNKGKFLREYETILQGELVYWSDYSITDGGFPIYIKSGITRIGGYVFVIQKLSDTDEDNEEANEIFKSIRVTERD